MHLITQKTASRPSFKAKIDKHTELSLMAFGKEDVVKKIKNTGSKNTFVEIEKINSTSYGSVKTKDYVNVTNVKVKFENPIFGTYKDTFIKRNLEKETPWEDLYEVLSKDIEKYENKAVYKQIIERISSSITPNEALQKMIAETEGKHGFSKERTEEFIKMASNITKRIYVIGTKILKDLNK